jgi:ankyrin repeat protein
MRLDLPTKTGNKGDAFTSQAEQVKNVLDCLLHCCSGVVNDANKKCWAHSGSGESPLTIAADDGLFGACASLLANGADTNFRVYNGVPDVHLFTPLLYAAKKTALYSGVRDQSALCRLLLQHDADPNARDAKGFSPLMWTVPDARTPANGADANFKVKNIHPPARYDFLIRQSVFHIEAAFQLGKERIDAQLAEEIRQKQVAAENLHSKLASVCLETLPPLAPATSMTTLKFCAFTPPRARYDFFIRQSVFHIEAAFQLGTQRLANAISLLQRCGRVVNDANKKCWANSGSGESPLTIAADDGLFCACASLLANGADANFRVNNGVPDGHLFTPLLYEAKIAALNSGIRDQSALGRLLPRHDADPNHAMRKVSRRSCGLLQSPLNKNEAGCCGNLTQPTSICLPGDQSQTPRKTSRRVFILP